MNNSTYPNIRQEAIFVPVQKCPYHVTFDLDLEHTLDADLPGDHCVQVWWRSGHLPARSDWSAQIIYIIYISYIVAWQTYRQTDYNTSLPLAGEVTMTKHKQYPKMHYQSIHQKNINIQITYCISIMLLWSAQANK